MDDLMEEAAAIFKELTHEEKLLVHELIQAMLKEEAPK